MLSSSSAAGGGAAFAAPGRCFVAPLPPLPPPLPVVGKMSADMAADDAGRTRAVDATSGNTPVVGSGSASGAHATSYFVAIAAIIALTAAAANCVATSFRATAAECVTKK